MTKSQNPKCTMALKYAACGIAVFLCNRKKRPLTKNGFKAATTDPEIIRAWFKQWPAAQVAIATGPVSNIIVVDLDVDEAKSLDGRIWFDNQASEHGGIPKGPIATTPRGGRHHYFKNPTFALRNSASKIAPGVDVRADGGYVLAPPSEATLGRYDWIVSLLDVEAPELPDWLARLLDTKALVPIDSGSPAGGEGEIAGADAKLVNSELEKWVGRVEAAKEGKRNDTLNRAAYICGRIVAAGGASESAVRQSLTDAAQKCGLELPEIARTVNSGFSSGLKRPWKPLANARELSELNRTHFFALDGKAAFVFREDVDPDNGYGIVRRFYPGAFKDRFGNRKIIQYDENGKPKLRKLGVAWLEWEGRRQYDRITFAPGRDLPPNTYNLWQGFAVQPQAGCWEKLREFLFVAICASDQIIFDYLAGWCAYAIQHPDRPGEVAVVMRGEKGVGKSFFATHFGEIFGAHFVKLANSRHLVGNFNAHLETAILVFADEAFWAGDVQNESILKDLVTAQVIRVEQKGVDSKSVPNRVHLMMASNADWVVPATGGERRYLVLDVNPVHQQDTEYFNGLHSEWNTGGREAFLDYLINLDLSDFNVRKAPATAAMRDQKLLTFSPIQKWWFECLTRGQNFEQRWDDWVETAMLWGDYKEYCDQQKLRTATKEAFGMGLQALLPLRSDQKPLRRQKTVGPHRIWGYEFPTVAACRAHFDKKLGEEFEWDDLPRPTEPKGAAATPPRRRK